MAKVAEWHDSRGEFVKRAAFALIASLALHDKKCGDKPFLESLRFIERATIDERNFVKKGVSWALRAVGRRNAALNTAAVKVAQTPGRLLRGRLHAGWGRDALRELTNQKVVSRIAAQRV